MPFPYTLPFALPAGDITVGDVEQFTGGRLLASDAEVQRMLDAALATARRYTGWHVSPVITDDVVVLDGPGSRILQLPTRKLRGITEIVENTVDLDLTKLTWSATGAVRKKSDAFWTCAYRSITATIDHGYTAAEAADWRQAILSMVDEMSFVPATVSGSAAGDAGLVRKKVAEVEYQWGDGMGTLAERALFSVRNILDDYRLLPVMLV